MEMFDKYTKVLETVDPIKYVGVVQGVKGLIIQSHGPRVLIGELCQIIIPQGRGQVWAEVVGIEGKNVQLMPFEEIGGLEVGCLVIATGETLSVAVSREMLGRVFNSIGKPLDGKGPVRADSYLSIFNDPPDVLTRQRITQRISTGIRAIDGILPVGKGQRLGIFSGSGVGKSTLLGMIARNTNADVNVIALIGERGREVRDFLENDLGEEGLARSVVVVSSSNTPPLARLRGAYVATAIAEYFRDQGNDVMLLFDSVTRFARAQREIGLSVGEPPATRGYTPSVFSLLPKLLERCGTSDRGTITGFYTILVEGDDIDEPVSDNVRGILDGHIVLSRKLAQQYHYPAIDVLQSISRLSNIVSGPLSLQAAAYLKRFLAIYMEAEDLINVGAYAKGSNPAIDEAIAKIDAINDFLIQPIEEHSMIKETLSRLAEISGTEIPFEEMADEALSV